MLQTGRRAEKMQNAATLPCFPANLGKQYVSTSCMVGLDLAWIRPKEASTKHAGTDVNLTLTQFHSINHLPIWCLLSFVTGPEDSLKFPIIQVIPGHEGFSNLSCMALTYLAPPLSFSLDREICCRRISHCRAEEILCDA